MGLLFDGNAAEEQNFRFLVLLLTLVAMLLVPTYFEDADMLHRAWMLCASFVMFAALYSLSGGIQTVFWLVLLLIPSFLTNWMNVIVDASWVIFADNLTTILYFSMVGYYLLRFILRAQVVTSNAIYGALCLYMVIAIIWAAVYNLHFHYFEASFSFSNDALVQLAEDPETSFSLFNYYSFVTLTTLGYGDIAPVTRICQAWVAVEAMVGQFYLAIIIARLVSSYRHEGDA